MSKHIPEQQTALVVTYDKAIGSIMTRILTRAGIDDIKIAQNVDEARANIYRQFPNFVITDWTQVKGAEVVEAAKNNKIPNIIVMSGGLAPFAELKASGVEILEKPFDPREVIALIRGKIADSHTSNGKFL